mmetsp:Transcript_7869/g.12328  ORF Transcript_7869/g.12328 Transcript_7869/m.12328 type:complete len:351 (-) Transcript_7869:115-1167(-)|eukprot:CAMPEP_0201723418 /NCGR_PEP_ID=MMETSP0593-20130828/7490_1 /ASSEMBLY_ACC=CAM_ASM_000672 /TAXON_ID=267983 /ORGANISM="Skeletonema japonicum, Strain CCMP2506" /LENGTH=350 /DNA_ID=CAMNT_0048214533 /DNA_START=76 /DNA_END=1128 /DNA_ORIENTATION=-
MAFNKMFVMLPVMLAARKLDGEDPNIVFLLRCCYGAVQACALLLILFVNMKAATAAADKANNVKIYVAPPPQPFADPDAKTPYQEKILSEHIISEARKMIGSTIMGICMTLGMHYYKGMIIGLAIQSIMTPFNLAENALVSALIFKGGLSNIKEKRIFNEKSRDELGANDKVTDAQGNPIVLTKTENKKSKASAKKSFEDILLDTWDLGAEADIAQLMAALNKKNINYATKESAWTPIMVMSGLGAKGGVDAMKEMKKLGANPSKIDQEGWNALHWSAYHGSADAAKCLLAKDGFDGIVLGLHEAADKEGKSPLVHAKDEGNADVARVIEEAIASSSGESGTDEGIRKRK